MSILGPTRSRVSPSIHEYTKKARHRLAVSRDREHYLLQSPVPVSPAVSRNPNTHSLDQVGLQRSFASSSAARSHPIPLSLSLSLSLSQTHKQTHTHTRGQGVSQPILEATQGKFDGQLPYKRHQHPVASAGD